MRATGNDGVAMALSNSSFDAATDVELLVKTKKKHLRMVDMQMNVVRLESKGRDGNYQKFVIPRIEPWNMALISSE